MVTAYWGKYICVLLLVLLMATACGGSENSATTTEVQDATAVGDPERGREIWANGGGVIDSGGCVWCHSIDGTELTGDEVRFAPSLLGVSARAGNRIAGVSAEDYLRESIVTPSAFVVEGYPDRMHDYRYELQADDLDSVIAFLLTL